MSKSSGFRLGGKSSGGNVTVLDARVHRSAAQNARMSFFVTLVVVGILSATVASGRFHPIIGLFLGVLIGAVTAALVWALVRVWPVLRVLWWWAPEILLATSVVYGWVFLVDHLAFIAYLAVTVLVIAVPLAIPVSRRFLVSLAWCLIVRHRLRVCFSQFIITNRSGSLPLILIARPTKVGERVWVYLRPGLSLGELERRLPAIAVACHAALVTAVSASTGNAAYLRLDIKRRDALNIRVNTPLTEFGGADIPTPDRAPGVVPTALDLTDVGDDDLTAVTPGPRPARKPSTNGSRPVAATATAATGNSEDDDWI